MEEETEFLEDSNGNMDDPKSGQIVSFVQERFSKAETARETEEARWLQAYRNYRGIYGPEVQFTDTEKSRTFVKVTKTKVLAAYGQITEVLFGANRFPISINPTKLPEGVEESVHIETNAQVKEAESKAGLEPLRPGETMQDYRNRLGPLQDDQLHPHPENCAYGYPCLSVELLP